MEKIHATEIVEALRDASAHLDGALSVAQSESNEAAFDVLRKRTGEVLGSIYVDVLRPIFAEHPSLEPPSFRELQAPTASGPAAVTALPGSVDELLTGAQNRVARARAWAKAGCLQDFEWALEQIARLISEMAAGAGVEPNP